MSRWIHVVVFFLFLFTPYAGATVYHVAQNHGNLHRQIEQIFQAMRDQKEISLQAEEFIKDFREVYDSQKMIYQWLIEQLKKDNRLSVYNENYIDLPSPNHCKMIGQRFSNFSPETPTYEQMLSLVQEGAPNVLYCTGRFKILKPGDDPILFEKARAIPTVDWVTTEKGQKAVFDDREQWVVHHVLKELTIDSSHDIAIVFGAIHDFRKYFVKGSDRLIDNADFARVETYSFKENKALFNPVIDFAFFQTGFLTTPERDKSFRYVLQKVFTGFFKDAFEKVQFLNQNALLPPAKGALSRFEYAVMLHQTGALSMQELRSEYLTYRAISAVSQSVDLNQFMQQMAPIYHPDYRWDASNQRLIRLSPMK